MTRISPTTSCGLTVYSNKPNAICKNCQAAHHCLTLNPKIVGPLADETGCVGVGKLIWSDRAWTELFFGACPLPTELTEVEAELVKIKTEDEHENDHSSNEIDYFEEGDPFDEIEQVSSSNMTADYQAWRELTDLDYPGIKEVEEKLLYSRVTLTFGWSPAVGRLCVLGVEW